MSVTLDDLLRHPFWLAPMEGVTHPAFRDIMAAQGGIQVVCTEFVRVTSTPHRASRLQKVVHRSKGAYLSVQVMGKDLAQMKSAADIIARAGADVVDINLGCPSPKAVRGGVGSAMLQDPDLLYDVVCTLREVVPGVLTAKMRAGVHRADGVFDTASLLEKAGVDLIAVHPRRTCDAYEGVADWKVVRALARHCTVPIIGNGDVWYAEDAWALLKRTGAAGVMIGRGALRNPWLFTQIEQLGAGRAVMHPDGDDVLGFFDHVVETFGARFQHGPPMGKLKELVRWLSRTVDDQGASKGRLLRHTTLGPLRDELARTFAGRPAADLDLGPAGRLRLERSALTSLDRADGLLSAA